MISYASVIDWLKQHMLTCPSKKMFSIDCPGCGLQRSILELLKGNLIASWQLYPPGIFVALTIIVLFLHLVFKFSNGAAILKYLCIGTTIIMAINYIYKITTNQIV